MRKCNSIVSIVLVILLLIHLFIGAFVMLDIISFSPAWKKVLSVAMVVLLLAHIVMGTILTIKSIRITNKSSKKYLGLNKKFWISRISAFLIIILGVYHIYFFMNKGNQGIRLKTFEEFQLLASIVFVLAILVHIITNIKSTIISLGIEKVRKFSTNMGVVLLIVFIGALVAFVWYYIRWNILWRL